MTNNNINFDITVIGAGIHGAGVAQAAAANGYSVLLLEQFAEPAQGTSSKSSKLIHGGLRYLEQGNLKLVYECLRERKILLKNAPELVKLRPFYIPLYQDNTLKPWKLRAGLSLYSILSGLGKNSRFYTVPQSNWNQLGSIKKNGLKKVFCYQDAQTDDAALTRAVIKSAKSMGTEIIYSATFNQAIKTKYGYQVHYNNSDSEHDIATKTLVHATGPWINHSMSKVFPGIKSPDIDLVQGSHIVLPGNISDDIFYLQVSDGRAVFVLPWKNNIMIGTTEYVFNGAPADCQPTSQEINYLLAIFNYYFPNYHSDRKATTDDIIETFAGLRVLPKNSKNPFARTRETVFIKDRHKKPELVGIYGGKLTSYRATADKVITMLQSRLPKNKNRLSTINISLTPD